MKTYNVYLTEFFYGNIVIKAKNEKNALARIKRMIDNNEIPYGIVDESEGYKINGLELISKIKNPLKSIYGKRTNT